jgi:autotransporter-associated beta strand protein
MSLTKSGTGTLTLSGANTYTGTTSVTAGTLALLGGSLTSPVTVDATALLGFTVGSTTANSSSTLTLTAGAKVRITGTPTLASYTLMTTTGITGTPVLETPIAGYELVKDGTSLKLNAAGGFSSWVSDPLFGLPGGDQDPTDDPENDGMKNLLEYALNGDPSKSDTSILPDLDATGTTFVFSYDRLDASLADTTQTFLYGSNLAGWTPIVVPSGSATVGAATITVINSVGTDKVSISIPKTEAGLTGKLFGRLQVTQP